MIGRWVVAECQIQLFQEHFVCALLQILAFSTFDGFAWKRGGGAQVAPGPVWLTVGEGGGADNSDETRKYTHM